MTKTKLKIRIYGDPILRKKSTPVKEVGTTERMLISAMIEAMHVNKGVGLAAPQVGISKQIIVADIGEGPIAIINPRIIKKSSLDVMEEGCLSVPGVIIKIRRSKKILLRYLDKDNNKLKFQFEGLTARVIQHEMDHLAGRLIADYASIRERFKNKKQLKELSRQSKKSLKF